MAWSFVAHRGSKAETSGGKTISINPTTAIPAGAVVIVRGVFNGLAAGGLTLSDSQGNSWTELLDVDIGTSGAGDEDRLGLYISKLVNSLATSDTISMVYSQNAVARVAGIEEFSIAVDKLPELVSYAASLYANASIGTVSLDVTTSQEYLWYGLSSLIGDYPWTFTQDPDYANNTSLNADQAGTGDAGSDFGSRIFTGNLDTYSAQYNETVVDLSVHLVVIKEVTDPNYVSPSGGGGWFIF